MSTAVVADQRVRSPVRLPNLDPGSVAPIGGAGYLVAPAGIAVATDGRVLVADAGGHRLATWDPAAGSWSAVGSAGAGDLELSAPGGLALDGAGRAVVADTGNHRLVRFDPRDGSGWVAFGGPGAPTAADPTAIGLFADPRGVAVDAAGRILVVDPGAGRLVRLDDLDGSGWTVIQLSGAAGPLPYAVAAAGAHVAVVDARHALVHLLDADGGARAVIDAAGGGPEFPTFVAIGADGVLAIADAVNDEVVLFDISGAVPARTGSLRGTGPEHTTPLFERIAGVALEGSKA